jgi:hypothetical protein
VKVWQESPQAFIQESRCVRCSILSAEISLGCCVSHCTTPSCMSSSNMNLRAFRNSPQMWKSHDSKSGLYGECWKHLPLYGIQLVLKNVDHMGIGTVVQKNDIFSEFTHRSSKVRQSHYRPGQALRVPGSWDSQISRHSAHEGGNVVSTTHRPPLPPPQEIFVILISVRSWVNPGAIM